MSSKETTGKTLIVAFLLCIVCSIVVASSVVLLKPIQQKNKALNLKSNILAAAGLLQEGASPVEIEQMFSSIEARLVDLETGEYVEPSLVGKNSELEYDQRRAAKDPEISDSIPGNLDIASIKRRVKYAKVYLVEEKLTWAKRFPDEFYKQIYRLKEWKWPSVSGQTPRYVGKLTNKLVYDKLPEGVLSELKVRNPTKEGTNQRKWKHHQFLSEDIGQADLRDHLLQLLAIMRISRDWPTFIANFEMAFPEPGQQTVLEMEWKT